MTLKILTEENNKLIGRKEVRARVTYAGGSTPNRDAIKSEFKGKNVVIRKIKPEFGDTSAIVEAIIYESKEIMEKIEAEHIKKKNEEKPKEEASAEEKNEGDQ